MFGIGANFPFVLNASSSFTLPPLPLLLPILFSGVSLPWSRPIKFIQGSEERCKLRLRDAGRNRGLNAFVCFQMKKASVKW